MGQHAAAKPWWRDALERIGWTAAEAAVSAGIVIAADLDFVWAPILTTALTVIKTVIAKRLGDGSAAIGA